MVFIEIALYTKILWFWKKNAYVKLSQVVKVDIKNELFERHFCLLVTKMLTIN